MTTYPTISVETEPVAPESLSFLTKMASLMPGIIYVFNQQSMSNEYTNRSVAELLGYSSDEVLDMGDALMPTIMYPEDLAAMPAHFAALSSLSAGEHAVFEYRVRARDGRRVWLRSVDTVFDRAPDGSVLRHLGIAFDISEQKEAQEKLCAVNRELEERVAERTEQLMVLNKELEDRVNQRTKELRAMNAELQQLTHVATHDLKGPINNICCLTHILKDAEPMMSAEHVETLTWIRQVSAQARDKLDTLVSVGQLHDVELGPFTVVDMEELTETALASLHSDIQRARGTVTTDFSNARHLFFLPQEFQSMMAAVISNALRYAHHDRRPKIEVFTRRDGDDTIVSISDNGSGLRFPQDTEKVFALFQRAHSQPEGSGVALYTIQRLLTKAGAHISVAPNTPHGCVFTLKFPERMTVSHD